MATFSAPDVPVPGGQVLAIEHEAIAAAARNAGQEQTLCLLGAGHLALAGAADVHLAGAWNLCAMGKRAVRPAPSP